MLSLVLDFFGSLPVCPFPGVLSFTPHASSFPKRRLQELGPARDWWTLYELPSPPDDIGRCEFCGRIASPLTKEHVFPQWLVTRLKAWRVTPSAARLSAASASERIGRITVGVCATCNTGWMSSLEVSFRRAVFPSSRLGLIAPPTRVVMSRWFTKTAILIARASAHEFLPPLSRSDLAKSMPAGLRVDLARLRRPRQPLDYAFGFVEVASAGIASALVVQVDDLVALVGGEPLPRGQARGTRLWPLRSHALRWETLPVVTRPSDLLATPRQTRESRFDRLS